MFYDMNEKNAQPPTIIVDSVTYYWDNTKMVYLDTEGSCGSYGALLDAQGWFSAWQAPDCWFLDCGSEPFDDPASAIRKSHSEFS